MMGRVVKNPEGVLPLSTIGFVRPSPMPTEGEAPTLDWLPVASLVVDHSYQRPIRGAGPANIRRIAANFRWSYFAPVIVSRLPGGKYAIVDGQHRATAALILGFDAVPCMIVEAKPKEQAAAFKAINNATTRMNLQAIHAASVAAGDKDALALEEIASCAGVTILRYPLAADQQDVGGLTMAIGCPAKCLRIYGRDTLITALQCVTQTANNNPGVLVADVIKALCEVLTANKAWREAGGLLFEAFDEIDIESTLDNIRLGPRPKGSSVASVLSRRISEELRGLMKADAA